MASLEKTHRKPRPYTAEDVLTAEDLQLLSREVGGFMAAHGYSTTGVAGPLDVNVKGVGDKDEL